MGLAKVWCFILQNKQENGHGFQVLIALSVNAQMDCTCSMQIELAIEFCVSPRSVSLLCVLGFSTSTTVLCRLMPS